LPLKNEKSLFHTGFCKYVVKCSEQIKISLTPLFTSVFIIAQNEMAKLTCQLIGDMLKFN